LNEPVEHFTFTRRQRLEHRIRSEDQAMRSSIRTAFAAVAIAAATLTAACTATPTPYQPYVPDVGRGVHGGYSDQQQAPDRFIARFG
jgi:hypothetical protein